MASVLTTNVPFNGRLFTDANFTATNSLTSSMTAFDFVQAVPSPTTTDKLDMKLSITTTGTNTGSVVFQHSNDNVTFVTIPQSATVTTQGASTVTASFHLGQDGKRYVRASGSLIGTGAADSYTFSALF